MFRLVDVFLCLGGIAILMIGFTDKGQKLGDIVAGTTLVKVKKKSSILYHIQGNRSGLCTEISCCYKAE